MLVLLVGPKGSGKSYIGRLLERRLGAHFFHVEPLWLAYHAECSASGREPNVVEGMSRVRPELVRALAAHARVCVETTGASREILESLLSLAHRSEVRVIRIRAPLEVCLRRISRRDPSHQIPMDEAAIREVRLLSEALELDADVTIDNVGLAESEIVALLEPALRRSS